MKAKVEKLGQWAGEFNIIVFICFERHSGRADKFRSLSGVQVYGEKWVRKRIITDCKCKCNKIMNDRAAAVKCQFEFTQCPDRKHLESRNIVNGYKCQSSSGITTCSPC